MEKKIEIKQFNKKLLVIFLSVFAIFVALLISKSYAMNVPAEIESLKESDRSNPTYLTYSDLVDFYDILCCQHGAPLKGSGQVQLHVSEKYNNNYYTFDMGNWQDTGYHDGSRILNHTTTDASGDFVYSIYDHFTYGYYKVIEQHIATPKEAYIIAEMKKEKEIGSKTASSAEIIYDNGIARAYTGSLVNAISMRLSTGELAYTVNQKYVLKTDNGSAYYVSSAKDANNNTYYIYDTNIDGSLINYTGDYTYVEPKTGRIIECTGVAVDNVYYSFDGKISNGNTVASSNGILYLVDFDMVIEQNGTLYYADVASDYNYIQIAWWSTDMGTSHGLISPTVPNSLAVEAEEFERYILSIAGQLNVQDLQYQEQEYKFTDENGNLVNGSIKAPALNYKPGFNEDADQNGVINEADEITTSFDYNNQTYLIGPFSLNYIKSSSSIAGRNKVDFAGITGVNLIGKIKGVETELKLGNDWNFKYLTDQSRDFSENYIYPNRNEVFYLEIKYIEDLTEIKDFSFEFNYMNAGAELDIFDGNYNYVIWQEYVEDSGNVTYDGTKIYNNGLQCTVIPYDSQTLAHALKGARWYNTTKCSKSFGINSSTLTIEKVTLDEAGEEIVPINRTFQFKIYIDDKEFQDITVTTKDGKGSATSNKIIWNDNKKQIKYKIVELGNYTNNGPWEGIVTENTNVIVEAKNFITPKKGSLQLDKTLVNSTPALDDEVFNFEVKVTGKFKYNGGPITTYTNENPLKLTYNDAENKYVRIKGGESWFSNEFKWYGSAPEYKIEEIIPDNGKYELVNGKVSNGTGSIENSNNPTRAEAKNQPNPNRTVIQIDKRFVSETMPQPDEVFIVKLKVIGYYWYYDEEQGKDVNIAGFKEYNVILNVENGWSWTSPEFRWRDGDIPRYQVVEDEEHMPDGTIFYSISDESVFSDKKTIKENNFESILSPEKTLVIITNDRPEELIGKIHINKFGKTDDLYGKIFKFNVKVTGTFEYDGVKYNNDTYEFPIIEIKIPEKDASSNVDPVGEWNSNEFKWLDEDNPPIYTIEEIDLPNESTFVSIGNNNITHSEEGWSGIKETGIDYNSLEEKEIAGYLKGIKNNNNDEEKSEEDIVVINCINIGKEKQNKYGKLLIKKDISSSKLELEDLEFYFNVDIYSKSSFRYYFDKNDETKFKEYTAGEHLKLNNIIVKANGEPWSSGKIEWDENDFNPEYTVEETNLPDECEFVSISNGTDICTSVEDRKITGNIQEGTDNNIVTAINKFKPVKGSIIIKKEANDALSGQKFYFDLKVTGEFDYKGKHYTKNKPYTLKNIEVVANGKSWKSKEFTWDDDKEAPKYFVKEVKLPNNVNFVKISNGSLVHLKNEDGKYVWSGKKEEGINYDSLSDYEIAGYLKVKGKVEVTAENNSIDTNNLKGKIQIEKQSIGKSLERSKFYFNVDITSESPFKYHYDLTDYSKVKEYKAGEHLQFVEENAAVAVADGDPWISKDIEWKEGDKAPTYTISEITSKFPNRVKSVSIENDTEIITKELDKNSTEKLEITGNIVGNDTIKITAINKKEDEYDYVGKIQINKLVQTEDLCGKTFKFNVKVTGTFEYDGKKYNNETYEFPVEISITKKESSSDKIIFGTWKSKLFSWKDEKNPPKYSVKEIDLPEGSEFSSISNVKLNHFKDENGEYEWSGNKEEGIDYNSLDNYEIAGYLDGIKRINNDKNIKANKVVISCTNTGISSKRKSGHIAIVKTSKNEAIDDIVFPFKVTISGKFRYYDNPNGTIGYTEYDNDHPLVLENIGVVCGGEDWISELITWDENDENPTYIVEETDLPPNTKFISITNGRETCESEEEKRISGILLEGTDYNYITAENTGDITREGTISIIKESNDAIAGQKFYFNLTVLGEFDYNGEHYTSNNPYVLENIEVKANGNPWISEKFTWDENAERPKYFVKEINLPDEIDFVKISNGKLIHSTKGWSGEKEDGIDYDSLDDYEIAGYLKNDGVKVIAKNRSGSARYSHIKITKKVLNENLHGKEFYFNIDVTSESPFRYHDLEDVTKVTEYGAGQHLIFEKQIVYADQRDWISGVIEWDEGAEIPTYTISEITGEFPNGVESVSIENDEGIIIEKRLNNQSTENLTITGTLTSGTDTSIIAVNDKPLQGKIVLEKKGNSIIEGEKFTFSVKITSNGKFKYFDKESNEFKEYKELELNNIKITANGPKWESEIIEWSKEDGNPKYTVIEETATFANGVEWVCIRNAHKEVKKGTDSQPIIDGTVEPNFNNWIIAENRLDKREPLKGQIQIYKKLVDEKGNEIKDIEFKFNLRVTFANGTVQNEVITVKSGSYGRSSWYNWNNGEEAPKYHIEEINSSGYKCEIDKPDGQFVAQNSEDNINGIVTVKANNTYEKEHKAKIKVNKELIIHDKLSKEDVKDKFQIVVTVTGEFTYNGNVYNNEKPLILRIELSKDCNWTWTLPYDIKWKDRS